MFKQNCGVFLLASALLLTLTGCAGTSLMGDSRPVEEVVRSAEESVRVGDYAGAARLYAVVSGKEPAIGRHYLRRAELLERLGNDKEAFTIYKQGLEIVKRTDPDSSQLLHRAALNAAKGRLRLDFAEKLVSKMTTRSFEQLDTTAFLYYQSGQYDDAVKLLGKALGKAYNAEQKGLALYHLALAYAGLKDRDNTYGAIYYALNHVEHLGVLRSIEDLWRDLNDPRIADAERWPPQTEQCITSEQAVFKRARMITVDY